MDLWEYYYDDGGDDNDYVMILFFFCAYSFSCGRVLNVHILSDAGRPW